MKKTVLFFLAGFYFVFPVSAQTSQGVKTADSPVQVTVNINNTTSKQQLLTIPKIKAEQVRPLSVRKGWIRQIQAPARPSSEIMRLHPIRAIFGWKCFAIPYGALLFPVKNCIRTLRRENILHGIIRVPDQQRHNPQRCGQRRRSR